VIALFSYQPHLKANNFVVGTRSYKVHISTDLAAFFDDSQHRPELAVKLRWDQPAQPEDEQRLERLNCL
jgi:hypothetical protein